MLCRRSRLRSGTYKHCSVGRRRFASPRATQLPRIADALPDLGISHRSTAGPLQKHDVRRLAQPDEAPMRRFVENRRIGADYRRANACDRIATEWEPCCATWRPKVGAHVLDAGRQAQENVDAD